MNGDDFDRIADAIGGVVLAVGAVILILVISVIFIY